MHIRLKPAAALLLPLFAGNLQATTNLDTIVVTATRFESAQQENPIAAQVITADEIRNSAATTVGEVLNKLGGVHSRINFVGTPDSPLDLRGFGMTGDQNTLVLVDGQRISENELVSARLSAIPLDSIERIEILRGSGSVLYGSGASSGTINIITRSALAAPLSGNVSARVGSHDLSDLRGGFRAGGERWGLRLNAQRLRTDNYRDNNRSELDTASGELRFGDRDGFVAFAFSADDQNSRLPGARSEAQLRSDRRGTSTPDDYFDSRSQRFSLRGERRLGELTLALDIARRDKRADMFNNTAWGSTLARTDVDVTTVSPRLLWQTRFDQVLYNLTVGADWSHWSYDNDTAATGFMSALDESGKQKNRAFYLRNDLHLAASGTRISLGGRKESIRQTQHERLVPRDAGERHSLSAYELALQQELGAGFSAYGRIGRSFRIANIDENRCRTAPCPTLLKPQRSLDREIGARWQGAGASFGASLFEMDISNEIHYFAPTFSNINLDPTRHRGIELEGRLQVTADVDLAARYTRTQARFRDGSYGGTDVTGNDVPLVPKHRASLNLGWQVLAHTRLGVNLSYTGEQRYDNDQPNRFRKMPAYTVTDIKLAHDIGDWRLALGVNNLFDRKFYSYGIVNGTFTSFNAYPEDRRNAYLSAEYRF
jgi:iron complex outermembrane receptor protein